MTEDSTAKQEGKKEDVPSVIVLETVAILFFILSVAASIVLMLLPLNVLPSGAFLKEPESALWLLFSFGLVFTILLNALGAPKDRRRTYWTLYGRINVVLGFLCAAELFWLTAWGETTSRSLWSLLAVTTVLGTIGVYLTERVKRREAAESKRKADEAFAKAHQPSSSFFRFNVRRYRISENKVFVCKD